MGRTRGADSAPLRSGTAGRPTLWIRRQRGDLDNFIAGVCDWLGAAHPWSFDADTWADLPPETHPGRAIVFTGDSWIRRIEAELLDSEGGEIVLAVEPLGA